MSTRDRTRLADIAKVLAIIVFLGGTIWAGLWLRDYERERIAEAVVEKLRQGGGR